MVTGNEASTDGERKNKEELCEDGSEYERDNH